MQNPQPKESRPDDDDDDDDSYLISKRVLVIRKRLQEKRDHSKPLLFGLFNIPMETCKV